MSAPPLPYGLTPKEAETYKAARQAGKEAAIKSGFEESTFVEVRAWWGDQDPNTHVNNSIYFRWLEAGRIAFMRAIPSIYPNISKETASGFTRSAGNTSGETPPFGLVLGSISNTYIRAVVAPDTVLVAHQVKAFTDKKMIMESFVYSYAQQAQVCKGEATMVTFDFEKQKSLPLPEDLKVEMEKKIKAVAKL